MWKRPAGASLSASWARLHRQGSALLCRWVEQFKDGIFTLFKHLSLKLLCGWSERTSYSPLLVAILQRLPAQWSNDSEKLRWLFHHLWVRTPSRLAHEMTLQCDFIISKSYVNNLHVQSWLFREIRGAALSLFSVVFPLLWRFSHERSSFVSPQYLIN